jgi:4-amino-4-deoxy-L-arabinose transferase-like glycosyltransferase
MNEGEAAATGVRPLSARIWLLAAIILALLVGTRIPLAPKYLYYFDSVNFALALEDFDPSRHQPQPPGYPLFVGLMRLLQFFLLQPEQILLAAGILAALAAILLVWRLGAELFGMEAGCLAAALLIFNPPFWFGGLTNQVRLCLAFCGAGVALLGWRALCRQRTPQWLYAAFGALGIAAGFRPTLGLLLLPLLLWVWWKTGASARRLLVAVFVMIATAIPWITATVIAVGGMESLFRLMWDYSNEQFRGTSMVFGASAPSAWRMATWAIVWNGIGSLAWIWAAPFVRCKWRDEAWRQKAFFLLAWFLPIFLFSLLIHIGDPDQALASIPVVCIAGGGVLARFLNRKYTPGPLRVLLLAGAVAMVNAYLFFYPPRGPARASGYNAVVAVDYRTRSVIDSIKELRREGPVTILHYRGIVTWRQLAYYFPQDYVVYLPANPGESSWTIFNRETLPSPVESGELPPQSKRVILLDPFTDPAALAAEGWTRQGLAYYRDLAPRSELKVGPYRLASRDKSSLLSLIQ